MEKCLRYSDLSSQTGYLHDVHMPFRHYLHEEIRTDGASLLFKHNRAQAIVICFIFKSNLFIDYTKWASLKIYIVL